MKILTDEHAKRGTKEKHQRFKADKEWYHASFEEVDIRYGELNTYLYVPNQRQCANVSSSELLHI